MLGGLLLPLYRGRAIHLTDVWRPAAVLDAMRAADLTAGSGATVFLTSLLDAPGFTAADAARIGYVGLGSAPVPVAVAERAEALGIGVARVYGSTEHPSTTGSLPDAPRAKRNRTDGRALAGVELRLVDDRRPRRRSRGAGRDLEPRPRPVRRLHGPRAHRATPSTPRAGTRAATSASSTPTATSRSPTARRTSSSAAARTSAPPRSRSCSRAMPGVAEVAVVAAPDPRLGEHACAFVRPRPGAAAPDLAAVRRHLEAAGLARPKWPEELRVVEDFPRTPSGKIKKFALRDDAACRARERRRRDERAAVASDEAWAVVRREPHGHLHVAPA